MYFSVYLLRVVMLGGALSIITIISVFTTLDSSPPRIQIELRRICVGGDIFVVVLYLEYGNIVIRSIPSSPLPISICSTWIPLLAYHNSDPGTFLYFSVSVRRLSC